MKGPKLPPPQELAQTLLVALCSSPGHAALDARALASKALEAALELHRATRRPIMVDGEPVAELEVGADGTLWATLGSALCGTTCGPAESFEELEAAVRAALARTRAREDDRPRTPAPRSIVDLA